MVITGYRIHSTDIPSVEKEIQTAKKRLNKISNQIYQDLLGREAAFLYDQMSLNVIKQPEGVSFLDWVINELNLKIQIAQKNNAATDYNFNTFVFCMTLGEYTYLRVTCPNKKLLKGFSQLEEYHLDVSECKDQNNKKNQVWQKLCGMYSDSSVFTINLSASPKPEKDKIRIEPKKKRCETQARHDLLNRYLTQISGGGNIPPHLLMPCMDMALGMLLSDDAKIELNEQSLRLQQILQPEDVILKYLFPEDLPEKEEKPVKTTTNEKNIRKDKSNATSVKTKKEEQTTKKIQPQK